MAMFSGVWRSLLKGKATEYFLRDEFTTALAVGSVDGTASEPGPGTRDDVNNNTSIVGGALVLNSVTDIEYFEEVILRVSGRVYKGSLFVSVDTDWDIVSIGFDDASIGVPDRHAFQFAASTVLNIIENGTAIAVSDVSGETDIQIGLMLWDTGCSYYTKFGESDWILQWVSDVNNTASLYAGIGGSGGVPNVNLDFHRVTNNILLQKFLLYDSFTATDGPRVSSEGIGPDGQLVPRTAYTGTGTIISNQLGVVPILGAEVIINGEFTTDTSNWTANNATLLQTDSAIDPGTPSGGADNGVLKVVANAGFASFGWQQSGFTGGEWYKGSCLIYSPSSNVAGVAQVEQFNSTAWSFTPTVNDMWERGSATARITGLHSVRCTITGTTASDTGYFDSLSIKQFVLSSLLHGAKITTLDTFGSISLTCIDDTQQGIFLRLDSVSAPLDGIHIYIDRASQNIYIADVTNETTYSVLSTTAFTYSAGATLKWQLIGTDLRVYYNSTFIVAVTVATITGVNVALFATDADSRFDNFRVFPAGSNNEYNQLEWF